MKRMANIAKAMKDIAKVMKDIASYDPAVVELRRALKLAQETQTPPEVVESIRKAVELVELRDTFTESATSADTPSCSNIIKQTYEHDWDAVKQQGKSDWNLVPVMVSGHLEGQFLKSMVSIHNAKRVLDIGMYTGYSALSMAEALPADGELVTIDKEKYLEEFTGSLLKASPHSKKIHIHIGPAVDYMRKLVKDGKTFDLMFLDADKREYSEYLKIAFDEGLLVPRGTVLIDNTFMYGKGYTQEDSPAKQLAENLKANTSLHCVLIPMRDGVTMVRRKSDVYGEEPK